MLICHISNYIYTKNKFYNIQLAIPQTETPVQYNKIYIENNNNNKQQSCSLVNEAQIPCKVIASCSPSATKYELTENDYKILYKYAYETAGLQVLTNTLKEVPSTTRAAYQRPSWWW